MFYVYLTDGVSRPTNLNLSSSESSQSKFSPLSSSRTMSRSGMVSPALSPRQPTSSPVAPPSPRQLSSPSSKTPVEESTVKVTVNHDQCVPEAKKTPPPVAPKPKHSSPPDHSKSGSHWGGGGYVSSAVGRTHSFGKKEPPIADSKPHIHPQKADYVSSARKNVHEKEEKGPIDTVVFASVDFNKMNANSRHTIAKPSDKSVPEPKMIPKGHVDYVSSAKPTVSSPTNTSPKSKDIGYSPYAYEETSTKISPVRLNSALSPRRKSEDKFSFGSTFSGNRTKGKEGDNHSNVSPLSSPRSPVTSSSPSPNIAPSSLEGEIEVKVSPEVGPKPVPRPRGSTSDTSLEASKEEVLQPDSSPCEDGTKEPCDPCSDGANSSTPSEDLINVDVTAQSTDVNVVPCTEALDDVTNAPSNYSTQNECSHDKQEILDDDIYVDENLKSAENDVDEDVKSSETSELLAIDDTDSEMFCKFVEEIVRNAIQKGIDEFKTSEADDLQEDNEEGKMVDEISAVHDPHPKAVMETKSLRAFLQKLDSSEKETPFPDSYSLNQNPVAESIAKDMLKTVEDSEFNASYTNITKTSANTSNDLHEFTNTNNGEEVDHCMSVSNDACVACNDVVLDSPNPVSMAADVVNVNASSVASDGNNVDNALLIQEPKLCTELPSEDFSGDCVSERVRSDAYVDNSQEDLENIEIMLNEGNVNTCALPLDLLGGGISQTETNSMDYSMIHSDRPWTLADSEQRLGPDDVNLGVTSGQLSPLELEAMLNQANKELDAFGYGLDAKLVILTLNNRSATEGLGVQLSATENGLLRVSSI